MRDRSAWVQVLWVFDVAVDVRRGPATGYPVQTRPDVGALSRNHMAGIATLRLDKLTSDYLGGRESCRSLVGQSRRSRLQGAPGQESNHQHRQGPDRSTDRPVPRRSARPAVEKGQQEQEDKKSPGRTATPTHSGAPGKYLSNSNRNRKYHSGRGT